MKLFIIILSLIIIVCLAVEKILAVRHRHTLRHVIHVNGTRGKSSVARLIAAGLSEAGIRTYCKTTGTLPMTIDPDGNEKLIRRFGKPNIREQITTLIKASESGAEVLVIECMAVDPELQHVCEHQILHSDIGVITNARVDHVAEMGSTTYEVSNALSNTIPENGIVFTSDNSCYPVLQKNAETVHSKCILTTPDKDMDYGEELFPENIALALAVCEQAGADKDAALKGMKKVKADPFAVTTHLLQNGALFINAMSANDPESTGMILDRYSSVLSSRNEPIWLLNLRGDRGYRTNLMTDLISQKKPQKVWLVGSGSGAAARTLQKAGICEVRIFKNAASIPLCELQSNDALFAAGNIAGNGFELMERIRKESEQ